MFEIGAPDPRAFWQVLGQRATGMTVVTAGGRDGPLGFLGLSAAHVSASPPTMLVSISRSTRALEAILETRSFAVNFLPAGAEALADAFSGKVNLPPQDRFAEGEWQTLATGAPILKSALGAFDCAVDTIVERDDTVIAIGLVKAWSTTEAGEPLLFFRGRTISGLKA